jgi:hypothetical protein
MRVTVVDTLGFSVRVGCQPLQDLTLRGASGLAAPSYNYYIRCDRSLKYYPSDAQ